MLQTVDRPRTRQLLALALWTPTVATNTCPGARRWLVDRHGEPKSYVWQGTDGDRAPWHGYLRLSLARWLSQPVLRASLAPLTP
jgi:hypothetical protein